jgi:dTDP-4-dehydrorhamnose 3,5-epimerase
MAAQIKDPTMPDAQASDIADVKIITPVAFSDARGWFCETYSEARFRDLGIDCGFVQDNQSLSREVGTIRGLHFQTAPRAQAKLVRVLRGRIFDVAVDLRRSRPTFGQWMAIEISADDRKQIFVPAGFAHGFCTLEPDTEILYKVSDFYSPEHDKGIAWDDPDLGIPWPVRPDKATLSDKDRRLPRLASMPTLFE